MIDDLLLAIAPAPRRTRAETRRYPRAKIKNLKRFFIPFTTTTYVKTAAYNFVDFCTIRAGSSPYPTASNVPLSSCTNPATAISNIAASASSGSQHEYV
ncbi:MAG: hypothetical protein ACYTAO_18200, partial [Planctomycetota bacterium]